MAVTQNNDVQFDEGGDANPLFNNHGSGMVTLLMRYSYGRISTPSQASLVLLLMSVCFIVVSLWIAFANSKQAEYEPVPVTGGVSGDVNWPPVR